MRKNKEKVFLSTALVLLMTVSIFFYALYIRQQIYYEGTQAMLETYEQVNKTFTMFAQRNWNVLTDWGSYMRDMANPETATQWRDFDEEKKTWNYSAFYMTNEDGQFWRVPHRGACCVQLYHQQERAQGRVCSTGGPHHHERRHLHQSGGQL